jgi:hypothetical protein
MKVTMYKANDGSLHETQKACDAKNVELRTAPLVEEFVNSLGTSAFIDASNDPITSGIYLDLADLPAFIVKHADALRTLLNKAVNPVGRPRKGSEPKERKPRAKKTAKADAPAAEQHGVHGGKGAMLPSTPPASGAAALDDVLADLS